MRQTILVTCGAGYLEVGESVSRPERYLHAALAAQDASLD
jgi:hypothetical protein